MRIKIIEIHEGDSHGLFTGKKDSRSILGTIGDFKPIESSVVEGFFAGPFIPEKPHVYLSRNSYFLAIKYEELEPLEREQLTEKRTIGGDEDASNRE